MPKHGFWSTYRGGEKDWSSLTRQQRRRVQIYIALASLRDQFGGIGPSGSYYYPEGMTRRIMRQIARATSRAPHGASMAGGERVPGSVNSVL